MKTVTVRTILLCVSLLLIGLFFTSLSYAKIDSKTIVGMWLFDEGKGDVAKDTSGNGNDGTVKGPAKWVDGKFKKALEFDGVSSYVDCGNNAVLAMTKEVTVAFWLRNNKKMAVFDDRMAIAGKHYTEYEVGIYPAGAIHTYTFGNNANNYDEGINTAIPGKLPDGDADWTIGKWFHLAWTLKGKHEIAYVNGVKIGEFDKPTDGTKEGVNNFEIGRRVTGSLSFNGAVDEVFVCNVALSEANIQSCLDGMEKALGLTAVSSLGKLATSWGSIKFGY